MSGMEDFTSRIDAIGATNTGQVPNQRFHMIA
jgi:hypothetical protein